MILYLIPITVIVVSLVLIIFTIIKKFPDLAIMNVDSIAKEKENKVINRIMLERLKRESTNLGRKILTILNPLLDRFKVAWSRLYQKVQDLEREHLKKSQPLKTIDINQEVSEKVIEAEKSIADNEFEKAEELCIAILELDSDNLDAYNFLGGIYSDLKDYKKSRETYRYLIKLLNKLKAGGQSSGQRHQLANAYADLGLVYELEGKKTLAQANYQKAVDLEPNNPRFLDLLLKISIILENKPLAQEVFESLKKADPENGKLAELQEEVNNLKSVQT